MFPPGARRTVPAGMTQVAPAPYAVVPGPTPAPPSARALPSMLSPAVRPIAVEDTGWVLDLVEARLAGAPGWRRTVPPGLRRLALRASVRACVASGRGWTDGRGVAFVDPPGAGASWSASAVEGAAVVLVAGAVAVAAWWQLWAGAVLVAVVLGWLGLSIWPARAALAVGGRARPAGSAWLHGVAKPAGDPAGSATVLLAGVVDMARGAGWTLALETDHEGLVRRYGELGFTVLAAAPAPWGRRVVMAWHPDQPAPAGAHGGTGVP